MNKQATMAAVGFSIALGMAAQAQTNYFKADNGTAMVQAASWIGGVVPGTGDRVWFSENTANRSANTGVFNHNWIGIVVTNSAFNWTIASSRWIRLGEEGITMANASDGGNFTIATELLLLTNQAWHVEDAARTLSVGWVTEGLGNVAGAGPVAVTKTGAGTLSIGAAGTNSVFSGLVVNAGTVSVGGDNVLGTGTLVLNDGASFVGGNKIQTNSVAINGNVNIDGNGVLLGAISGSGSITHGGGPAFRLNLRGDNSGFSGVITNNATLATDNKDGFGTASMVLNDGSSLAAMSQSQLFGADAIANGIELNGTVKLGASNAGGNFELAGDISGDGGLAMTVLGGFDVRVSLSGANSYAGPTDVLDGFVSIDGDSSAVTGTVTVSAGAGLGGGGTVGGDVVFEAGAKFLFSSNATLTAVGASVDLGTLGVADVDGLDGSVEFGTYALMDGAAAFDFGGVQNLGAEDSVYIGGGKKAYFVEDNGLKLVVAAYALEVSVELLPGGGGLVLGWKGESGDTYGVEATTDLVFVPWEPVASNYAGTGGLLSYTGSVSEAKSFFRVVVE